jgi:1-phosphofructokinase family hexose kinase
MILTLTPNPALDRLLFIDQFQPGAVMRTPGWLDKVGGKGLDTSVALSALQVDTLAISFMAGSVGRQLAALLNGYGIRHKLIWVEGETRLSHVVVETGCNRHSHLIAGTQPVTAAAAEQFLQQVQACLPEAAWVVAAGSLPPGLPDTFFRQIIALADKAGKPVLLDSADQPVQAVLSNPPAVLKMNRAEFCHTFSVMADTLADLIAAARQVAAQRRLPALVLTCGEDGLLAFTPAGNFHAAAPVQAVVNAAGAGDAASGALAWRLWQGDSWPEALRRAAAISAASVLTPGTADINLADVERILPQTQVTNLGVE